MEKNEQEQKEKKQRQSRRRRRRKEEEEKMEMEMQNNFQPQKDYNSPNQCLSVEAQISKQRPDPLSVPELVPTAQGRDFEGDHELEDRQPTEALVTGGNQQPQSEEHTVDIPDQLMTDPEAADEPMINYSGWLSFLEAFILGHNQRNQIWRLRLLSGISLYLATVVGFLFYIGDLHQAQAPYHYQMAMLIMSVGAPIVVAVIGLFLSLLFSSVPNRQTSWITGLSVANFIMLCGLLAIYWALDIKRSG